MTKGTFLIVEDLENDALLMRRALQKAGINNPVIVVEDGKQALQYLSGEEQYADRTQYPLPCLILLDLKMPEVDGFEVLQWIREHPSLPPMIVVVLTASNLQEDIGRAYRLGANSYVVKPNSLDKLVDIAKDLANWWIKHNEITPFRSVAAATRLNVAGMSE